MPITLSGVLNTAALVVPDLYVQVVTPGILALNGVPSNLLGIVGTASYGPVNQPVVGGGYSDYVANFGPLVARTFDMGTHVATAQLAGATAFTFVRVTDGTDTAATLAAITNGGNMSPLFTAAFTGSNGTATTVTVAAGKATGSFAATIARAGRPSELFDNGLTTWAQLVSAINNGISGGQPASKLVVASAGTGTAFAIPTTALVGGTDGATTITPTVLLGVDGLTPTGMYCLRNQGCSVGLVADLTTSSAFTTVDGLASSEGIYMMQALPNGTTIAAAVTAKQALGFSAWTKLLHGDFLYFNDTVTGVLRMVSPQGFAAGRLSALSPQQSGLNKLIPGIAGSNYTGSSGANRYSEAQLQALFAQDIDLITSPQPGGAYWGLRLGHNASGNAAIDGDNYPRLTTFIARTLAAGMGTYVGQVINASLLSNIQATLLGFLGSLLQQGILGSVTGALPYAVVCNGTNNPQSRTSLGYVQADVQVQYQGINEKFIVNLQGGTTVQVTQAAT